MYFESVILFFSVVWNVLWAHWIRFNLELACAPFFPFVRSFNFHLFFISIYVITAVLFGVLLFFLSLPPCSIWRQIHIAAEFACTQVMFKFSSIVDILQITNSWATQIDKTKKSCHNRKAEWATETEENHENRFQAHAHCAQFKLALF